MKDMWRRVWFGEPVIVVGGLVSAWTAVVALDQASDGWVIPVWVYVVAVPLTAFLTGVTRGRVTPALK